MLSGLMVHSNIQKVIQLLIKFLIILKVSKLKMKNAARSFRKQIKGNGGCNSEEEEN